ncbi:MAG: hypothetical protein FWG51_04660 [Firmicutes bacterium]|nr:hypothetical protein [Bacillota bacterium]
MEFKNKVKQEFDKIESSDAQKAELSRRVKLALRREESNKQKERKRSLWTRVVASSMAFVLICGAVAGGYLIFRDKGLPVGTANLEYAKVAYERARDAQYTPDAEKLVAGYGAVSMPVQSASAQTAAEPIVLALSAEDELETDLTIESYNNLISVFGWLDSPYNHTLTVDDIRLEAMFIFSNIPVYDEWIDTNYGLYRLSYNEETGHISIIHCTSWVNVFLYDSENQKFSNSTNGTDNQIDRIKRIDYYYENNKEVVECEIVNFLNFGDSMIVEQYQYLKNIKDTSFTKYIITPAVHVTAPYYDGSKEPYITEDEAYGYSVFAADSYNSHGISNQFFQLDYNDSNNISLLFVDQIFAAKYNDCVNAGTIDFYNKTNDAVSVFKSCFAFGDTNPFSNGYNFDEQMWYGGGTLFDMWENRENNIIDYVTCTLGAMSGLLMGKIPNHSLIEKKDENYAERSTESIQLINRKMFFVNESGHVEGEMFNGLESIYTTLNIQHKMPDKPEDASLNDSMLEVSGLINNQMVSLMEKLNISNDVKNSFLQGTVSNLTGDNGNFEENLFKTLVTIAEKISVQSFLVNNYTTGLNLKTVEATARVNSKPQYINAGRNEWWIY